MYIKNNFLYFTFLFILFLAITGCSSKKEIILNEIKKDNPFIIEYEEKWLTSPSGEHVTDIVKIAHKNGKYCIDEATLAFGIEAFRLKRYFDGSDFIYVTGRNHLKTSSLRGAKINVHNEKYSTEIP